MKNEFMQIALKEAKKAYDKLEIPVVAVIVKNGEVIAKAHNLKETKFDTTKHAEILAIQKASKKLESWRLLDCEMYVTLEPCSMCAGAIINAQVPKGDFGAYDLKNGACGTITNLFQMPFNFKPVSVGGIMHEECSKLLTVFFKNLRNKKS